MAQVAVPRVGRPLKYPGGWSNANKRIYLSEGVYHHWRTLRSSLSLSSDNEVAEYLLNCHFSPRSSPDSNAHGEK